jgi:hypothetical protein
MIRGNGRFFGTVEKGSRCIKGFNIADRASDGMMRIRNNILVKKLLIFNIKSQSASILGTQIKGYR